MIHVCRALTLLLLLGLPGVLHAHSVLFDSQPSDGAVLSAPPDVLHLRFAKGIRLTAASFEVGRLTLPDQEGFAMEHTLSLPSLGAGTHTLEWRGLSLDGHAMKGTLSFTVE